MVTLYEVIQYKISKKLTLSLYQHKLKKREQLVSMMPAIKKTLDLIVDDIVEFFTENGATISFHDINLENNSFSRTIPEYWTSRGCTETFVKLQETLELRVQDDNKLHVEGELVSMMPAMEKAFDLIDDIVEFSTENHSLKNKKGSYDKKWSEESKAKLLKQMDDEKRAYLIISRIQKQMKRHKNLSKSNINQ